MLIIIEGPDGGGKSTLCAALADGFKGGSTVIHTGPPDPPTRNIFAEYEQQLDTGELFTRVRSLGHLVILDRWHLGDLIYGPKYRGFARWTEAGLLHGELTLSSLGALKVMCLPPLEVITSRVQTRGDEYIQLDDLPRIHAEYTAHADRYGYIVPDYTMPPDVIAKMLVPAALELARAMWPLHAASSGTYTGALGPAVIFAGDTPGALGARYPRPFTPADGEHGCSEWLLSALLAAGGDGIVTSMGLVNVNAIGVSAFKVAEAALDAKWVALGRDASRTLRSSGVPHEVCHHPQHARRFRYHEHSRYGAELITAAGFTPLSPTATGA